MRITSKSDKAFRMALTAVFAMVVPGMSPLAIQAQYLHPKVSSKQVTIRNIVILPAKVQLVRDSMKGPEGMAAESEELSARVEKILAEVLAGQKHVATVSGAVTPSSDGATEQKYSVADFQSKFDLLLPKIMKKRKDVKAGRFSMGDEVLNLNLDKTADAQTGLSGQKPNTDWDAVVIPE